MIRFDTDGFDGYIQGKGYIEVEEETGTKISIVEHTYINKDTVIDIIHLYSTLRGIIINTTTRTIEAERKRELIKTLNKKHHKEVDKLYPIVIAEINKETGRAYQEHTLPDGLLSTASKMISMMFINETNFKLGDYSVTYKDDTEILKELKKYKKPRFRVV